MILHASTQPVVYRKGIPFEFPQEIMDSCRLRPNQQLTSKQFWKALVLDAEIRLDDMGLALVREEIVLHG